MKAVGWIGGLVALLAFEPAALGCSAPTCVAGFLPRSGAVVPANLPALLWDPTYGKEPFRAQVPTTTTARILDLTTGAHIPHVTEATRRGLLIRPTAALVPGHEYAFEAQDCFTSVHLNNQPLLERTTFTATRARAFPTTIGALRIVKEEPRQLWLPFTITQCNGPPTYFDAMTAEVELVYSVDAEPFEPLYFLQLRVDGRRVPQLHDGAYVQVPHRLGQGDRSPRGRDLVILVCETGRERQTFSVTMEAELPGVGVFETPPITVSLECSVLDAGVADVGSVEGPADAGALDAGEPTTLVEVDPGCGCRTSPSGQGAGLGWGLVLAGVWRRRGGLKGPRSETTSPSAPSSDRTDHLRCS